MTQSFDVLVVGGGIVGLTAALAMAKRNYTVAIIDAGSLSVDPSLADLRVYAINQLSQALLQELDVWPHVDLNRISPYHQMYVWDSGSGAHIDFDSRYIASSNLGIIIEESVLKQALFAQISLLTNITLFPNSSVNAVSSCEQNIKISSQDNMWQGQLLMIADGANSPTRQQLNVEFTTWSYNQNALIATVQTDKPHQKTAYQVFNSDGPLAFLPLADPHQCSIVWSTETTRAKRLMELCDTEFNMELNQAFSERLGKATLLSTRHQFPLHMRHVKQYTGQRWLLLGDAAHTIHPLAGLGLNVGLADIHSWLNCLDTGNGDLVSKKALGAYQRERKHNVWQIIALMEGFKRLFSNSNTPLTSLRGLGLRACNELTPIKRLFIKHAAGSN